MEISGPRPSHLRARWAVLFGDYRLVEVKRKDICGEYCNGVIKKWKWCPSGTKLYRAISLPFGLVGVVILLSCMAATVWMMFARPGDLALIKSLPVSFGEMSLFALCLMGNVGMSQYWSRRKPSSFIPSQYSISAEPPSGNHGLVQGPAPARQGDRDVR